MTEKQRLTADAEALVRRILERTFHQKVSSKDLQSAARKVVQAVPSKKKQAAPPVLRRAA